MMHMPITQNFVKTLATKAYRQGNRHQVEKLNSIIHYGIETENLFRKKKNADNVIVASHQRTHLQLPSFKLLENDKWLDSKILYNILKQKKAQTSNLCALDAFTEDISKYQAIIGPCNTQQNHWNSMEAYRRIQ
ncbi:uncharacterized protein LOC143470891 [Clavelina lepadiformis]|uniref:uncharacterized protein LOC143470891 n=1 Tax=Clavelina lepadiformis TaxID=159417 RepID=UPI004042737B